MPAPHTPTYANTVPVMERHRFDAGSLDRYLHAHLDNYRGGLEIRQFDSGYSNPTFFVSAEMQGGKRQDFVLRKKPPGKLVASAHQVDREFRVISALARTDVPVAPARLLCADDSVIGQMFYLMDAVPGRILIDAAMPGQTPAERAAIFDSMNDVLARLHKVDPAKVGLGDYGRSGQYIARQVARWSRQYAELKTEDIPAMDKLATWLPEHIPAGDDTTVVHGDFRLGNVIMHPTEPRVLAVLDWELATLGHPLADLAYNAMPYHLRPDILGGVLGEDLKTLGIPTEADHLAAYCRRTGRAGIPDWSFYVAFSMFRLAAIAQGIMGRVIAGTANDAGARSRGERARPMAEAGWGLVESRR